MAKYENILLKESVDIKEFRQKGGICLPVIEWDVAMETALIQNLATEK